MGIIRRALTTAVLVFLSAAETEAHNGKICLARPVEGIIVDGDFSDWPQDIASYPIEFADYGDTLNNDADYRASFRVAYSAECRFLYVAIEVHDDSLVVDSTQRWTTQDGCSIYLCAQHESGPVIQYNVLGQNGTSTISDSGAFLEVDPLDVPSRTLRADVQQDGQIRRYEWAIPLRGLLEANHGGSIEIDSSPEMGTIVRTFLPLCSESVEQSVRRDPIQVDGRGQVVLVAEDNSVVRKAIALQLEAAGFSILEARDGLEAVEICDRAQGYARTRLVGYRPS